MFDKPHTDRASDWQGTLKILSVQLAVLFALAAAAVSYVAWSSNAARAEFTRATSSAAPVSMKPHCHKTHATGTGDVVREWRTRHDSNV
jgi:hypothetical protein